MAPEALKQRLMAAFPGAQVQVTDLTGTQNHYRVEMAAEAFRGLRSVQQHRLVYRALGEAMRGEIHALSLDTRVPS